MDTNIEPKDTVTEPVHEKPAETKQKVISVKTASIIAVVIILGALAFYYKGLLIAATVNGSPISRMSVVAELERTSGKQVLDAIVTKKLLNDEARKQGITVTSDEVNAEITKIEDQIKAQGGTLDAALVQQGITRKDMEEQLILQKKLEKLLGDKLQVSDEEAMNLLTQSKVSIPKGEEEKYNEQAKEQLRGQKMNTAASELVDSLRTSAKVRYFVSY